MWVGAAAQPSPRVSRTANGGYYPAAGVPAFGPPGAGYYMPAPSAPLPPTAPLPQEPALGYPVHVGGAGGGGGSGSGVRPGLGVIESSTAAGSYYIPRKH